MQLIKLLFLAGIGSLLWGQCTATYSDGSVDDANTTFTAWASVTDYYNSTCTPPWSGFTHTYRTQVSIQSPLGRSTTNYSESSQYGGGGTTQAGVSLAIDEDGTYDLVEIESIDCTVAGAGFFLASSRTPFFAFGKEDYLWI